MENNTQNENTFSKGLFIKMPPNNAPDFVLLNISVKPNEFFQWCQQFLTEESKGWVNIQIKRSKDGSKIYGQLDTWKPEPRPEQAQQAQEYNDNKYKVEHKTSPSEEYPNGINLDDHQFVTDAEKEELERQDALMRDIPFD